MTDAELLAEASDVLIVALNVWLADETARMRDLTEARRSEARKKQHQAYLATLTEHSKQIAEIDYRIDILAVTPNAPARDRLISELKAVRARLIAKRPTRG